MSRLSLDEKLNTITHAIGIPIGLAGTVLCLRRGLLLGDPWYLYSTLVFTLSMTLMYLTSTLFHCVTNERARQWLRHGDHCAIYLLIASSYTPFTLIVLREVGYYGWGLFALVWAAAIFGIAISLRRLKSISLLKTIGYIAMGLLVLLVIVPLRNELMTQNKAQVLHWLIGGGVSYIAGTYFYMKDTQHLMHAIWHLFVLGGSACHLMAIYQL